MTHRVRGTVKLAITTAAAALLLTPLATFAQTNSSTADKWIHVRVISQDSKSETVKVNVPLDMAEKVLPAIDHEPLHNGVVKINDHNFQGVDVRTILDAVRTAKDGEFVTVQAPDADVRVAKQAGFLLVNVLDKSGNHHHHAMKDGKSQDTVTADNPHRVEVKVPMKVVDALFSGQKDELNIVAAIRALAASGDTELVSVKDDDNTVRVWVDSKNISD